MTFFEIFGNLRRMQIPGPFTRCFLKEWRKKRRMTQEALSQAMEERGIDLSGGSISRIERALQPYNQRYLEAWADILDCSEAEILSVDPTAEDAEAQQEWRRLKPVERARAIRVWKSVNDA